MTDENPVLLYAHPSMYMLAEQIVRMCTQLSQSSQDGTPSLNKRSIERTFSLSGNGLRSVIFRKTIQWNKFADGFPNLFIEDVKYMAGKDVIFIGSFHSPELIFEQLSVLYSFPRYLAKSFHFILPYFPTGTMERVDTEGQIATAKTLATLMSAIPLTAKGPAQICIFDIHALQERFYFSDNIIPRLESAVPLLLREVNRTMDMDQIAFAFPDDGAFKRFHHFFGGDNPITCVKIREGNKRIVKVKDGDRVEVVLGGDGRCDSPGYSAKYGSYTLMDLETSKILDVQLVQSNEVAGSTHMELEGLKRGLDYVIAQKHLNVSALVTDRHVMIKKYMRENHRNIKHYFDVWHIAKGISKKLEACAKKKTCEDIRPWIRSINNHAYWVAASSGDDREMKLAKWVSITNHVMNRHHHESPLFPRCLHEDIEYRDWLIEGSRSFKLVKGVVESQYLLRDLPQMSPVHQTYGLEVFHSVVNEFAPKSTHFFKNAMQARVYIAALHFNENGKRQQATKRDGTAQWSKSYPKAKKGNACVVKAKRTPPTFGNPENKHVIIVDDLVQTGGTLKECGKALLEKGATKVSAYVTHPVFPNDSWKRFVESDVKFENFWITDSIPHAHEICLHLPFRLLSLCDPIAEMLMGYDLVPS